VRLYRGHDLQVPARADAPDRRDLSGVRRWVRAQADAGPTAVDLFCGAGGLSLGLQNAGFRVLVGADNDARSVQTHTSNIGGLGYHGDLGDPEDFLDHLRRWGIRRVDLIAGGVPCQPFSRAGQSKLRSLVEAGQRPSRDSRAERWRRFVTIVERIRPSAVLLENVPDLAGSAPVPPGSGATGLAACVAASAIEARAHTVRRAARY
jgi:DNA (cytosine-5)-methyltransferase 1